MIKGLEFHSIIENIFTDVHGLDQSHQLQVNCPICQERDGLSEPDGKFNLEINTEKKVFRCWKCDNPKFSGSLSKLIRIFGTSLDYDLYKSYDLSIGGDYFFDEDNDSYEEISVKLPNEFIPFSKMDTTNQNHLEAYNYMILDRKFSNDILNKFRIGFCVEGKYAGRIIIPSYDENGILNYFVGRAYKNYMKKKYDNPKNNKSEIIFNEGLINWDSTVYIVEGVFDMLSIPFNSVPLLGKTISEALYFKLKALKPNIVILLDPDAYNSSIKLFYDLYSLYNGCEDKIKIIKLNGNEDIDEIRKNKPHKVLIDTLYSARSLTIDDYFIKKLEEYGGDKGRYGEYKKYFKW